MLEPSSKVTEVMTDFHFAADETKWIGPGRKTKRIHVVDKANQVHYSQTCKKKALVFKGASGQAFRAVVVA